MESPTEEEAAASAYTSQTFGRDYSFEVKEPVGAMSISPCGRDVVLASRKGLHIIDLDSPYRQPRHLPHYTPWEVADVQWSPFPSRDYWVVSTSNQKALVWNLDRSIVEHYLHAHTRAITDINFSAHNPDILATCAVDSFVHCWDLRCPSKPALSFADWFAGATQVKWNRQDSHIIASSHDRNLRIWDDRKGAYPLHSIKAHDTKIYGLDWNRVRTSAIITCSLDKTIKFWDYSVDTEQPERIIKTSFPIWRARHTPFGYGILAMPQRDDNDVYLYKQRADSPEQDISSPVKSFPGHEGQVKEFLWRCRGNIDDNDIDQREFQLVTWGADQVLRLHPMDDKTLAAVDYTRGTKVDSNLHWTRRNAKYKTFRDGSSTAISGSTAASSSLPQHGQRSPSSDTAKSGMTLRGRSAGIMGGFLDSRTSTHFKNHHKRSLNPISWMKGVKAGKKDASLDRDINTTTVTDHTQRRGSEEFESLGEEIVHVGTKFSKVKFEKAEDKQRYVKFGMRGVWELNGSSTYLECRIEFPEAYPFGNAPRLSIEKTARLDRNVLSRIEKDVQTIGDAHMTFKRNSLEAIVRYLHGDQSLEDALNWTKQDLDTSLVEFQTADESSSDEDEMGAVMQDHDTEFGLADSGMFEPVNANAYMPLAKPCAGVWAPNGTLVCFFPPKAETPPTLTGNLGFSRSGGLFKSGKKRMLGGLGKINISNPSKSRAYSLTSQDHHDSASASETSDSDTSTSTSSVSSREALTKDVAMIAHHVYEGDHFGFSIRNPDEGLDGTLKSTGSGSLLHSRTVHPRSIISLHDCTDLLSPKEDLAREYILSGPEACQYNSQVAKKYGHHEIAEVWTLLDLLLQWRVSEKQTNERTTSGLTTAAASRSAKREFIPTQFASSEANVTHPFGRLKLIQQLFEYYAGMADVQMLAMMTCVISEYDRRLMSARESITRDKYKFTPALRKLQDQEYSITANNRSIISSDTKNTRTRNSSIRSPTKSKQDSSSLSSSLVTVMNDNDSIASSAKEAATLRSFEGKSSTSKLSSSPEWIRPLHKSSSNLATAIMTSMPRSFSLTTSAASSPPTISFIKKKISPITSLTGIRSGWASGNSTIPSITDIPNPNTTKNTQKRVRISRDTSETKPSRVMTVVMKNPHKFEAQRGLDQTLLDPTKSSLYQAWRSGYAELLYNWDLLITRVELLKFIQPGGPSSIAERQALRWAGGSRSATNNRCISPCYPAARRTATGFP